MNTRRLLSRISLVGFFGYSGIASACGPFFPDSVLSNPQSALDVPPVSFHYEFNELVKVFGGKPIPLDDDADAASSDDLQSQIPYECAELRSYWQGQGVEEAQITERLSRYTAVRTALLKGISDVEIFGRVLPAEAKYLPANPLGDGFPEDVVAYVEGARLLGIGQRDAARTAWTELMKKPAAERRLRSVWACWMMARTSDTLTDAMPWFDRAIEEQKQGASDVLELVAAAKAWRADMTEDPLQALHLHYESAAGGRSRSLVDLRRRASSIYHSGKEDMLAAAAADPLARRLINLHVFAMMDHRRSDGMEKEAVDEETTRLQAWLALLEKHTTDAIADAPRIAWALYACGRYDESRNWLKRASQDDPSTQWLLAKFALRDGKTTTADRQLASAAKTLSKQADWKPVNSDLRDVRWFDSGGELHQFRQGKLLADRGVVALALDRYDDALKAFLEAKYLEDAAWIAEHVMTADELLAFTRKSAPKASENPAGKVLFTADELASGVLDTSRPFSQLDHHYHWGDQSEINAKNWLRHLTARRLTREHRFSEARPFVAAELLPLFDHYITLDRARLSGRFRGEALAAIAWRQALIHRHYGMELFGTEGAPDYSCYEGSFYLGDYTLSRSKRPGWSASYAYNEEDITASNDPDRRAIPAVSQSEIRRMKQFPWPPGIAQRFHYRYTAVKLAVQAARTLPKEHPSLAAMYNTAGLWIADSNDKAADPIYEELIRRCAQSDLGKQAEAKRWFIRGLPAPEQLPLPKGWQAKR